ncbi:hypothetical protein NE865_06120 [Phthorimaea operculella]|nr:hypothetical protein NE865_06120 [Phthorimaea operculella]
MAPKLICSGCTAAIEDRKYLRCCNPDCKYPTYDLLCANVSEVIFSKMTALERNAWKCVLCVSKEPKMGNAEAPARSANHNVKDGVNLGRRGASMQSPPEQLDETGEMSEIETLAMEFRQFMEEWRKEKYETHLQLQSIDTSIKDLLSRVETSERNIEVLNKRVEKLESRAQESTKMEGNESSLFGTIEQLKAELNERDQEMLQNEIEISCIPEEKTESLPHIVMSLGNKLGIQLNENDIVSASRVGRMPADAPEAGSRPRPIVVRLARRAVRDQFLQEARVRRGATTEGTGLPGNPRRFYINERLTRVNRNLFRKAREIGAHLNWRFIWTKDGRIFARQSSVPSSPNTPGRRLGASFW